MPSTAGTPLSHETPGPTTPVRTALSDSKPVYKKTPWKRSTPGSESLISSTPAGKPRSDQNSTHSLVLFKH